MIAAAQPAPLGCRPHRATRSGWPPRPCRRCCAPRVSAGSTTATGPPARTGAPLSTRPARRTRPRRRQEARRDPRRRRLADPRPRPSPPTSAASSVGYRFLHTAIDDRTRLAYSEVLDDEQGATAAAFWHRAHAWFAAHGITIERALTDNGSCYRSRAWRRALCTTPASPTSAPAPTGPRPTARSNASTGSCSRNGPTSATGPPTRQRHAAYDGFIHFYNHHRSHGALGWATPIATLNRLAEDNLPATHLTPSLRARTASAGRHHRPCGDRFEQHVDVEVGLAATR